MAASRRVSDPELLGHIVRHAKEELEHGELFRRRAAELRADSQSAGAVRENISDKNTSMLRARGNVEIDGHGFYDGSMFDSMGEVAHVAMVHVVERRALEEFEMHMACTNASLLLSEMCTSVVAPTSPSSPAADASTPLSQMRSREGRVRPRSAPRRPATEASLVFKLMYTL